jgi:hypothetical protein
MPGRSLASSLTHARFIDVVRDFAELTMTNETHISTRHLHQEDVARRWRISARTLERWRWLKQGPAYLKVGGRVVYRLSDVEAYEKAQLHRVPAPRSNEGGR